MNDDDDLVFCPQCKAANKESTLKTVGSSSNLLSVPSFVDKQGKRHSHNTNRTVDSYKCSNGHTFLADRYHSCWCGWDNRPKEVSA